MRTRIISVIALLTVIVIALLSSVIIITMHQSVEPKRRYEVGNEVLNTGGVSDAQRYFTEQVRQHGDPYVLFGTAWTEYLAGNYEAARGTCHYLLAQSDSPRVRANCHYLLGHIGIARCRSKEAYQHFDNAHGVYRKLGDNKNLFKTTLGLANAAILGNDDTGAEAFLDQALVLNGQVNAALDYYYVLRKKIAASRSQYARAFHFSQKAYTVYRRDNRRPGMVSALNNMAMYALLSHRTDEALGYLEEAATMPALAESNVERKHHKLCWLLYRRCKGLPYESLKKELMIWANGEPQESFRESLTLVLNFPCH